MSPGRQRGGWQRPRSPRPGSGVPRAAGRRRFGASWWGAAWVEALEQRAALDPNRLPRGRTYARSGAVGELTLAPGDVRAEVQGSRRVPYQVRVRVRPFTAPEWARVLDVVASEIGHAAALLDGELPPAVADGVRSVGLDLLPGPGELQPRCACPDWADPCKHAAAVCYLVADELDADPFGLLLLRGLGRGEVLAALRVRRGSRVGGGAPALAIEPEPDAGIPARETWSRVPGPLPLAPLPPRHAGRPTILAADPPPASGIDPRVLQVLAADVAARALALAQGGASSGLELTASEDLARRAANALDPNAGTAGGLSIAELAARAGVPARELLRRALAWRDGGRGGLAALDEAWNPDPGQAAAGRALLGPGAAVRSNRVTLGERQLRLGRDGSWYPFRKDGTGAWLPDGPPLPTLPAEDEVGDLVETDGQPREAHGHAIGSSVRRGTPARPDGPRRN